MSPEGDRKFGRLLGVERLIEFVPDHYPGIKNDNRNHRENQNFHFGSFSKSPGLSARGLSRLASVLESVTIPCRINLPV